jgi:hypothetical protein
MSKIKVPSQESEYYATLDQAAFYEDDDDDTVYVSNDESDLYDRGDESDLLGFVTTPATFNETVEGNPRLED